MSPEAELNKFFLLYFTYILFGSANCVLMNSGLKNQKIAFKKP